MRIRLTSSRNEWVDGWCKTKLEMQLLYLFSSFKDRVGCHNMFDVCIYVRSFWHYCYTTFSFRSRSAWKQQQIWPWMQNTFAKFVERSSNLLRSCISKMIPKTIQKWIIITSKNVQNPGLKAPKSRSGKFWGRFGSVLGHLGPSWMFLEASWTVLEASWKPPGPFWAEKKWPTWLQGGSQNGSQIYKKQSKNRSVVRCHLESPFVGFPSIFGIKSRAMLVRKCIQKSIWS